MVQAKYFLILFLYFSPLFICNEGTKGPSRTNWKNVVKTANKNLQSDAFIHGTQVGEENVNLEVPGTPVQPFTLYTLKGMISYPSPLFDGSSILFHTFNNRSAFLECLWTSEYSLTSLVTDFPENTHLVVVPTSQTNPLKEAEWMKNQVENAVKNTPKGSPSLLTKIHFVTTSVDQLGNWVTAAFRDLACSDHGCGLSQALFTSENATQPPLILKRLDARYDWLPSPEGVFKNQSQGVVMADTGCTVNKTVSKKIALVKAGGCSYSTKVSSMEQSGAVGVLVYALPGHPVDDMNCVDDECLSPPSISASMIPWSQELLTRLTGGSVNVTFQTTATSNFYFAIDAEGLLAEFGWLLYPSFQFFNWQAQWFNYQTQLLEKLSHDALVIPVINGSIMQGNPGIISTLKIPSMQDLLKYDKFELDASLSCPGTRDQDCPAWDHTVQLYVCCNNQSSLCGQELGRWITPFRRRIGRWLTDVTPLLPLLTSSKCTFNMKTVPWAMAWKPSLNLRFSKNTTKENTESSLKPSQVTPLFRGGTFNKTYNKKYKPFIFSVPADVKKVKIVAVITGHGSDENGCGEFCVTSHHFVVNQNHSNVKTFDNAGTPLGCAERTPSGVEPNEHGTWLYGRDGWCDGREVDPWTFDITDQLDLNGKNSVIYFGWFNGTDPNPLSNPGEIILYSYLVFYKVS
ncbi:hypothetical protein HOLleu_20006 [Holothuria leucospilota]|uniref:Peptide-N-glycosidase F N-terminal domain-containing protein n=1 Tax=Holothuria leucospilota TaxID=206669 RepID=A0A9Q1C0I2_HOLLE|nr:hypothetical protein HOLleu_20006 [Holothuria leucospilota]